MSQSGMAEFVADLIGLVVEHERRSQGVLFGEPEKPKYGYKLDGTVRHRPLRELEFEIFDMDCADVPDDHPQHLEFQRLLAERCEQIQMGWSESDWQHRRCYPVEPITFDEMPDTHA